MVLVNKVYEIESQGQMTTLVYYYISKTKEIGKLFNEKNGITLD